jgi:transposase
MPNSLDSPSRRTRRFHSAEFKSQVIQQCGQDRASVAGVALRFQVNANIVHRWLREHEQRGLHSKPAFIPLSMDTPSIPTLPVTSATVNEASNNNTANGQRQIQVEIRRGQQSVTISWPVEDGITCAAWLGEWLK